MRTNNRVTLILSLLLLAGFALACSSGDESGKANELIAQANKAVVKANEASQKGAQKIVEMEGLVDKIASDEDLENARKVARESKESFTTARDSFKEAGEGFTAAGKLKVNEKFKEYVDTKAAEFAKRSDLMSAAIDEAQAMLDSKDRETYHAKVKDVVEKFNKAKKEAEELSAKAEKIQADNKDVFVELKK